MKVIEIPDKYETFIGVKREVLKRGNVCYLESQDKGARFIVRMKVIEYSNTMMAMVEKIPDHQPYQRFSNLEEAEKYFAQVENSTVRV